MSDPSIRFWDSDPTFRDDVSDADAHVLRRVVHAMLSKLWPASATWQVRYHAKHYVLGCQVPKDVKITLPMFTAGPNVCSMAESWIESADEHMLLCCKVPRDASVSGVKRKRTT